MLDLLKLIPLKGWLYAGLAVELLIGFGVFVHHERNVGAASVVVADTKAVDKQIALNTKVEANAQKTVTGIATTFAAVAAAPPAADAPHLWVRQSPNSCTAVADGGTSVKPDGTSGVPAGVPSVSEGSPDAFDFGPPLDKSFETADAQITGLQDYIKECQRIGVCQR